MTEADRIDHDIERQLAQKPEILLPQPFRDPQARAPVRLGDAVQIEHAVGVTPHEAHRNRKRPQQLERLERKRAGRDVASHHDELGLQLRNDRLQRRQVAVDVTEDGDPRHRSIPMTGRIRPHSLGALSWSLRAPMRS